MKISYNWIRQFIKIDNTSEETASLLTDLGLEVESVDRFQSVKGGLEGIVVGHVLTCEKHPNADRLKVTTVDLGDGAPVQIVCGAANVAAGQKVPVATIGTTLFDKEGKAFQIKKGKIRDMESHGMICAEDEIGLGDSHDGILVLDAKLKPGTPVAEVFQVENDEVFEIGLTPNRADAMSHMGVARDLRAGLLLRNIATEFKTPSVSAFRVDKRTLKNRCKGRRCQAGSAVLRRDAVGCDGEALPCLVAEPFESHRYQPEKQYRGCDELRPTRTGPAPSRVRRCPHYGKQGRGENAACGH